MSGAWLAVAAGAVAFLLRAAALVRARRERAALADAPLLARLVRTPPPAVSWTRAGLVAAGAAGLAAAALAGDARPPSPGEAAERETVVLLDASNSMLARDVAPSRLERQRLLARRLVSEVPGRVGVVFFAGRGYVLAPVTSDRDAALMFVDAVDPSVVGRGGTALAHGLGQALDVLAGGEAGARRSIVLLSDGESTAPDDELEDLLARAARSGVPMHTVGIGDRSGARIPLPSAAGPPETVEAKDGEPAAEGRWLRDPSGQPVVTRLEEDALRAISGATGGLYLPGTPPGLDRLLRELTAGGARGPADARLPLHPLLLLAFLALWADGFLFRRG